MNRRRCLKERGLVLVAFAAALSAIGVNAANSGPYEQPPSFSAGQVLPPNLLNGPNYTIGNQVGLENFQYVFNVDTR